MAHLIPVGATAPALGIAAHIAVINGHPTTTTRDIAEVFGKRHDDVLRIVRQRMAEAGGEWCLRNFTEVSLEVPSANGGTISYPAIRMTEKGFMFVVQSIAGKKAGIFSYAHELQRMGFAQVQVSPCETRNGAIYRARLFIQQARAHRGAGARHAMLLEWAARARRAAMAIGGAA